MIYQPRYETVRRVNVYDGEHLNLVAQNIFLTDAIPADEDEQQRATIELEKAGRYWLGGGSAPLFLLTKSR